MPVRVLGKVTDDMLTRMKKGIRFEEGIFRFKEILIGPSGSANQWYSVTLEEGKYREVRRLWESQGCTVSRLIRINHGIIGLPRDLRRGQHRELTSTQVSALLESVGLTTAAPSSENPVKKPTI